MPLPCPGSEWLRVFVFLRVLSPFHVVNNLCVTAPTALCHISGPPHQTDLFLQRSAPKPLQFLIGSICGERIREVRVGYGFKRFRGTPEKPTRINNKPASFFYCPMGMEAVEQHTIDWKSVILLVIHLLRKEDKFVCVAQHMSVIIQLYPHSGIINVHTLKLS